MNGFMIVLLISVIALGGCAMTVMCGDGLLAPEEECEWGVSECSGGYRCTGDCTCERSSTASQAYWSTADIAFTSYAEDANGVVLTVRNNKAGTVNITSIDLDDFNLEIRPTILNAGQSKVFTHETPACEEGSFSHDVAIGYTDVQTGARYTFIGDDVKLEGTCATG